MVRVRALLIVAVCSAVVLAFAPSVSAASGAPKRLVVGALLDLSAGWTTLGQASRVTLAAAVEDTNRALRRAGVPTRVVLRIADAEGTAEGAAEGLRALAGQGARLVVGPQRSSEAAGVRELAGELGVLIVSQGSTAGALSIAGDALLRVVPDDQQEAAATVDLVAADGIATLVPVALDDLGNQGLVSAMRAQAAGSPVSVAEGLAYTPGDDPAAVAAELSQLVLAAQQDAGEGAVGVYLAGFDEAAALVEQASADPVLSLVQWYAGDGVANVAPVATDPEAAAAAVSSGLAAATLGLDEASVRRAEALARRHDLETVPDAFALAAYDAFRLGVRALRSAPGDSLASLRRTYVRLAARTTGITGPMKLNAAGDRAQGDYDFLGICPEGSAGTWVPLAHVSSAGAVTLSDACPEALARRVIGRFFRALQTGNRDALEAVLAPEFQAVRANGTVLTREEYLASPAVVADYEFGPFTVTASEDTIVASYTVTVDETLDGVLQPTTPAPRLSVLARHGGTWYLSAHANFGATN